MKQVPCLLGCLVVFLMGSCAGAEPDTPSEGPTGQLVGKVETADGRGLESDIGIEPDPYPMSDIGFTTDLQGRFAIDIPGGRYRLTVGHPSRGFASQIVQVVPDEVIHVDFVVHKSPSPSAPP